MNLAEELDRYKQLIDSAMISALEGRFPEEFRHDSLFQASKYAVESGGKRLRPALVLHGCELCGGRTEDAVYAAVALEMIHSYSLIHDDLPGMDNSDTRRGKPSVHRAFGEGMAILAGDALLTEAFAILALGPKSDSITSQQQLEVLQVVSEGSGVHGMVRGQELDLIFEDRTASQDQLKSIHFHKTAAMFRTAMLIGAILAGADGDTRNALTTYGENIGLAFQIRDDLLDIEGDSETLGKPTGADASNSKTTYPGLIGIQESRDEMNRMIMDAISAIALFGDKGWFLVELAKLIGARNR